MLSNTKRLYQWLPWASALALALVFLLFMRADLEVHKQVWDERLAWNAQAQKDYMEASGRDLTQQAMLLAQLLVRDAAIVDEIRRAHKVFANVDGQATPEQLSAARNALQASLHDSWSSMEEVGVRQLSIYFAPGAIAFLRMHRPDRFGDSLSGLRPLITNAFSSGLPAWGEDISRHGSGHRAVLPIMANDDQTGGVIAVLEVGMSSIPPRKERHTAPTEMAMFLRKAAVEQVLWEQIRQTLNQNNPTVVDDWRLEETSDPNLNNWWSRGLIPINQRGQLLHDGNKTFLISWWPIKQVDIPEEESALAMLVWSDITPRLRNLSIHSPAGNCQMDGGVDMRPALAGCFYSPESHLPQATDLPAQRTNARGARPE